MKPDFNAEKSIYLQIAESIEDDILQENIEEETKQRSTDTGKGLDKSLDLMKKLSDYLGY